MKKQLASMSLENKLNPEWKQTWVAALRSGNYTQGHSSLRDKDDAFCCLGVACDLFDSSRWRKNIVCRRVFEGTQSYLNTSSNYTFRGTQAYVNISGYPTKEVLEEFCIDFELMKMLAEWNDAEFSFEEIAQVIEECL